MKAIVFRRTDTNRIEHVYDWKDFGEDRECLKRFNEEEAGIRRAEVVELDEIAEFLLKQNKKAAERIESNVGCYASTIEQTLTWLRDYISNEKERLLQYL